MTVHKSCESNAVKCLIKNLNTATVIFHPLIANFSPLMGVTSIIATRSFSFPLHDTINVLKIYIDVVCYKCKSMLQNFL